MRCARRRRPPRPPAGPAAAVGHPRAGPGGPRPENALENASAAASAARSIGRGGAFRSVFFAAARGAPSVDWLVGTDPNNRIEAPTNRSVRPSQHPPILGKEGPADRAIARAPEPRNSPIPQFQFPDNSHSSRDAARETGPGPPNLRAPRAERTAKRDPPKNPRAPTRFEPVTIPFFSLDFTYFA